MARDSFNGLLDLSDRTQKRALLAWAGVAQGMYRVKLEPAAPTRSNRQNAFWHACVVEPFAAFLRDQEFSLCSHEDAHALLKEKFLRVPVSDANGEVIGYVTRSTTTLSKPEFAKLVDAARLWLDEQFGIVTPDPDPMEVVR